jgi:hypothetical protein
MKKRFLLWFTAGVAIEFWYTHSIRAVMRGPFGGELGSVAFPVPPQLKAIGLSGFVCLFIGSILGILDFTRWRRTRNASRIP